MKKYIIFGAIAVLAVSGIVISQNFSKISERLTGYEEVPALSTPGNGTFTARVNGDSSVTYQLTYGATETDVTQSHIHFENRTNNGPIVVFLCSNLGNGPVGTQACPAQGGTISGTFDAGDVLTAGTSGIAAGEFDELLAAMRAGATYVNVHTAGRPGGEIRSQIDLNPGFGRHDDHK
jgi:hypothetical protein